MTISKEKIIVICMWKIVSEDEKKLISLTIQTIFVQFHDIFRVSRSKSTYSLKLYFSKVVFPSPKNEIQ